MLKYSRYPKRDFLKVSQNVGAAPAVHAVEAVPGARGHRAPRPAQPRQAAQRGGQVPLRAEVDGQ